MSIKSEKFGKYLKDLRGKIPQSTLAVAIGKTTMYISNIENGKNNPPDEELLEKIADVLNLSQRKRLDLIDQAAAARNTVAQDLVIVLSGNKKLRQLIREANADKNMIQATLQNKR